jgi:uncharacterized glyoxalase superfamily protein PhnB
MKNRSVPDAAIIPVLAYPDVPAAALWLCQAFGFRERLRIGTHRVQLVFQGGAVIVAEQKTSTSIVAGDRFDSVLVRVSDANAHHAKAAARGAKILSPPADYPYGERQYSVEDLGGRRWTFSQSIADSDPASWGGELLAAE